MPKIDILNIAGEKVSDTELCEDIFNIKVNEDAVHTMVVNQLANKRQGTQSAKTRSEVRGGGRKPWRQKGSGRARHGSSRSPLWVGGGVVFAPKPRDYSYKTPRKIKRLALKSVLTNKAQTGQLVVVDDLALEAISTKKANEILNTLTEGKKAFVVTAEHDDTVYRSFRNIARCKVSEASLINVYDLVHHDYLVLTKDALAKIEEVFS